MPHLPPRTGGRAPTRTGMPPAPRSSLARARRPPEQQSARSRPDCFLFFITGTRWLFCYLFRGLSAKVWTSLFMGQSEPIRATKHTTKSIFSQHMQATKHTTNSQASLYEVRYLNWESEFQVIRATKHTLISWFRTRRTERVYVRCRQLFWSKNITTIM
jgi:hypothetical protein